ncbi:hypothetical protein DSM104443_00555 [Usitatibacter rugosus]|uniref:Uncharacterized protein n=2 Tax=Usitatibacter rugosus TaxID=2732067 RepID=A0A6M4GQJ1_9PROT|nr:hypothetical protein DSM104443_00555 [Usitatibacter rugosus]
MPAVVGIDEPVFLRIEYSGAVDIRLWTTPYSGGQPLARVKTNVSRAYDGSGTTFGWFSLNGEGRVEEVRIRAGGGKPYKEFEVARFPVDVRGSGLPGPEAPPRAQWVTDLILENEAIVKKERTESRSGSSASSALLLSGFGLAVMGFVVLIVLGPLFAIWKWHGPWRWLAALPLVVMAVVVGRIVIDTSRDPTSHNLWPFEILMFGGGGLAFFATLVMLRRVLGRRS